MVQSICSTSIYAKGPWNTFNIKCHLEEFISAYINKTEFNLRELGSKFIINLFGSDRVVFKRCFGEKKKPDLFWVSVQYISEICLRCDASNNIVAFPKDFEIGHPHSIGSFWLWLLSFFIGKDRDKYKQCYDCID